MRIACVLLAAALALPSCVTVRRIDETGAAVSETRVDLDTTIALTQLALTSAEQALSMWMMWQAEHGRLELAEVQAEAAARQARIEILRALLERLCSEKSEKNETARD